MAESSQKMFPLRIYFRNTKKFVENLRFDKILWKKLMKTSIYGSFQFVTTDIELKNPNSLIPDE